MGTHAPVAGLQREDFTLLDNNVPQTITLFEAVDGPQAPVEVILVIDAVNSAGRLMALEREEVKRFLKAHEGRLDYPTTFAILTDTGIQLHLGFSRDGDAISSALRHAAGRPSACRHFRHLSKDLRSSWLKSAEGRGGR